MLTLALLVPLTAGDYDLSVAATMGLSAMTLAILNVNHGWSIWRVALLAALGVGLVVGLINGALVVLLDIDSLIATLGSSTFIAGVILWISNSQTISGVSDTLINVDGDRPLPGDPARVLLRHRAGARDALRVRVHAGRPPAAVRGPRPRRRAPERHPRRAAALGALAASGVISAFAGILYAGTLGSADPTSSLSFLLPAFAAAFLGATTIMPGRFNPIGSIAAVYFLVTGITGLQLLGVETFVQQLFYGGALILAVALSQFARRRDARAAE